MREELRKILLDALSTKSMTLTQKIPELKLANHDIMCASRIASKLNVTDYDKIIELSNFIHNSWTDLETTDEQIELILDFILKIRFEQIL